MTAMLLDRALAQQAVAAWMSHTFDAFLREHPECRVAPYRTCGMPRRRGHGYYARCGHCRWLWRKPAEQAYRRFPHVRAWRRMREQQHRYGTGLCR
jgi:hypothetical protein